LNVAAKPLGWTYTFNVSADAFGNAITYSPVHPHFGLPTPCIQPPRQGGFHVYSLLAEAPEVKVVLFAGSGQATFCLVSASN
jgi:hypothetical protein